MSARPSPFGKLKENFKKRWSAEDYPGATPRFQIGLMAKDLAIFVCLPLVSVILFKSCEIALSGSRPGNQRSSTDQPKTGMREVRSQIIEFQPHGSSAAANGVFKRAPGTLVRVRLMNVVDTFGTAPVHAQIIDKAIGNTFMGGTLMGDATADTSTNRVNIIFRFARQPNRPEFAVSLAARALSLDGTLGIPAEKKEGFFARATLHASTNIGSVDTVGSSSGTSNTTTNSNDLNSFIARALATGLMQEFGSDAQVAHNQAQVLTLKPLTEFYAELTDFFPGQTK